MFSASFPDHAHLVSNIQKLRSADILQALAASLKLFVKLDSFFLHLFVGLLTAAKKAEIIAASLAMMAILIIKANSQQQCLALICFGHINPSFVHKKYFTENKVFWPA